MNNQFVMRISIVSVLLMLGMCEVSAQVTMREVISKLPERIAPYLNATQREELAHNAELRLADKQGGGTERDTVFMIKNVLEGETAVDSISDDFVCIALTKSTDLQVRLLSRSDSTKVLCVIKNISVPMKESDVMFYDESWNKIDANFGLPNSTDAESWLDMLVQRPDTMSVDEYTELRGWLDPVVINVDASNDDECLRFELSVPIVPTDKKEAMKAILRPVLFKWNGESFEKCQ